MTTSQFTFIGRAVIVSPLLTPAPKLQFTAKCGASNGVLNDINNWLLQRFGRGGEKAVLIGDTHVVVSPSFYMELRRDF